MAIKFLIALSLCVVASAGLIPAAQVYHAAPASVVKTVAPVAYTSHAVLTKNNEEYDPHPQYKYSYDVQDAISGDSKTHAEERDGDVVHGEYSLNDSDGFRRTVRYTADPVNGFQAEVHREPLKTVIKTVAPVAHYSSPTVVKTLSPVPHYTAPSYYKSVSPVAHYSAPTLVKHVSPATHYSAPTVIKSVAPVAHYSPSQVYTSYSAPASYVSHH